jgi:hypothetical protein
MNLLDISNSRRRSAIKIPFFLLALTFLLLHVLLLSLFNQPLERPSKNTWSITSADGSPLSASSSLGGITTLRPGELPGYTGWPRTGNTLVSYFKISEVTLRHPAVVGNEWNITVTCSHQECSQGRALLYTRAYGPAILSGLVHDHSNGSYNITFVPLDAGAYTLEVVLEISKAPAWDDFPLSSRTIPEPAYEGYTLPQFPREWIVLPATEARVQSRILKNSSAPRRVCLTEDLLDRSSTSGMENARWVPVERVSEQAYNTSGDSSLISVDGYHTGRNALGVLMDYMPRDCSILQPLDIERRFEQCQTRLVATGGIHLVYIGDSVMKLQRKMLINHYFKELDKGPKPQLRITALSTFGGIYNKIDAIAKGLNEIKKKSRNETTFLIFGAGLHDVHVCSQIGANHRHLSGTSCTEDYRTMFFKLVKIIADFPAQLRVYQSTTAGWLRYGNFGLAWPPLEPQRMPYVSQFAKHLNTIAFEIIQNEPRVRIMDGYWVSLPRPDHREVNEAQEAGKHMVHPGPEVLHLLVRKWTIMVLEGSCGL